MNHRQVGTREECPFLLQCPTSVFHLPFNAMFTAKEEDFFVVSSLRVGKMWIWSQGAVEGQLSYMFSLFSINEQSLTLVGNETSN